MTDALETWMGSAVTKADVVVAELINILKKRNYELKDLGKGYIEGVKKLQRIGVKRRYIYFIIKPLPYYGLNEAKELNKFFTKKRPASLSTFYFYNLVPVSEKGYSEEAMHYTRMKMIDSWNTHPVLPWDVFFTSYTKITHLISIKDRKILYPYEFDSIRRFIHKEVIEIFTELMTNLELV
ncbi:MAG: hypothetical protein DRO10_02690 [Thermoprotei archaeon]|nr:MAG: hypothetical protein DRO10_02690 [Thermoprotei archaeon]